MQLRSLFTCGHTLAGCALLACLAVTAPAPARAQDGAAPRMPRVTGMSLDDALARLRRDRISVSRIDTLRWDGSPLRVVRQSPGPGASVDDVGAQLAVEPEPLATVPRLIGSSSLGAIITLAAAHLTGRSTDVVTTDAEDGAIVAQDPEPGTQVPRGTIVRYTIARLPPIPVPDLTGDTRAGAEAELAGVGLRLGRVDSTRSDQPAGTVVWQSVPAGRPVRPNSRVGVRLAFAPPPVPPPPSRRVAVPDLSRMTRGDAATALSQSRLRLGAVDSAGSAATPAGTVFRQSPQAGDSVAPGSPVAVTLASALPRVPDLVGMPLAQARVALRQARLFAGRVTDRESPGDSSRVLAQSIAAGTVVVPGTNVDLVASVPQRVQVPDVRGATLAAARAALDGAGLAAAAAAPGADSVGWVVASQRPLPGTRAVRGSRVRLELAPPPAGVPTVVGLTLGEAGPVLVRAGFAAAVAPGLADSVGWIVASQLPPAGTQAARGTPVRLELTSPAVVVPGVVRLPLGEARAALARVGLAAAVAAGVADSAAWVVTAQRPVAGRRVTAGTAVSLEVAPAPGVVVLPAGTDGRPPGPGPLRVRWWMVVAVLVVAVAAMLAVRSGRREPASPRTQPPPAQPPRVTIAPRPPEIRQSGPVLAPPRATIRMRGGDAAAAPADAPVLGPARVTVSVSTAAPPAETEPAAGPPVLGASRARIRVSAASAEVEVQSEGPLVTARR